MTRILQTKLLVAITTAAILSPSVEGFSPSLGLSSQVRTVAPSTEMWAKKKKKKNKKKKKQGGSVAVLEPPPPAPAIVVEEEASPVAIEEPVAAVEVEAAAEAPLAEGELEDPALKMIANEMFQRKLLAQQFSYEANKPEAEPEPEPVAEVAEQEQKQEPEPVEEDLAVKYAAIDDVGERAYQMLSDLGMFDRKD